MSEQAPKNAAEGTGYPSGEASPKAPDDPSRFPGTGLLEYEELGFEDVYFEGSFVSDIVESKSMVRFVLRLALVPGHPYYEPPPHGEAHCYRGATLTFSDVRKVTWTVRNRPAFRDAEEVIDLGSIDRFVAQRRGAYRLEGDFGQVQIYSAAPVLELAGEPDYREARREELAAWIAGGPLPQPSRP